MTLTWKRTIDRWNLMDDDRTGGRRVIIVESLLTTWRSRTSCGRALYQATGPERWGYTIDTPARREPGWKAWAGRAISHTVRLGDWPTFEQARAACEEHAVRSQGVTVEVRS